MDVKKINMVARNALSLARRECAAISDKHLLIEAWAAGIIPRDDTVGAEDGELLKKLWAEVRRMEGAARGVRRLAFIKDDIAISLPRATKRMNLIMKK